MTMDGQARSLAVLIDADNSRAPHAHAIFEEIVKLGEANVRRIYGDFASGRLSSWDGAIQSLAILQHQQRNNTTGKNAADIALVIDAMDLMHKGKLDGFCLVSSDSDFTRLAQRLREDGLVVYGFGERKTPEAFRSACNRFIYVENLMEAIADKGSAGGPKATSGGQEGGAVGGHSDRCQGNRGRRRGRGRRRLGEAQRRRHPDLRCGAGFRPANLRLFEPQYPGRKVGRVRDPQGSGRGPHPAQGSGAQGFGGREGCAIVTAGGAGANDWTCRHTQALQRLAESRREGPPQSWKSG